MKPLKWYIAQGIVNKIIEDVKAGTFKVDEGILLQELIMYGTRTK